LYPGEFFENCLKKQQVKRIHRIVIQGGIATLGTSGAGNTIALPISVTPLSAFTAYKGISQQSDVICCYVLSLSNTTINLVIDWHNNGNSSYKAYFVVFGIQ
jgi:hypothetical protein